MRSLAQPQLGETLHPIGEAPSTPSRSLRLCSGSRPSRAQEIAQQHVDLPHAIGDDGSNGTAHQIGSARDISRAYGISRPPCSLQSLPDSTLRTTFAKTPQN